MTSSSFMIPNSISFVRTGLVASLGVALLAGCGSGSNSSSSQGGATGGGATGGGAVGGSETGQITIGAPPSIDVAIIGYARDKGLLAKNNLTIEIKPVSGGAAAVPALQSGAIQMASSNLLSVIQGVQKGLDVQCFAGFEKFGATGNPLPLLVGKQSGVTSAKDLEGKTVGTNAAGGINQLATVAYLTAQGADPSKVKFLAMPFTNMPQAVATGQVDAAVTPDPFALQMLNAGAKALTGNVSLSIAGSPVFSCWSATASWLKANPKTAQGFVAAMTEASAMANADFGSFREYLKAKEKTPADVADNVSPVDFTTKMSNDDITTWTEAAKKYGMLNGDAPDPSKVYVPVGQ